MAKRTYKRKKTIDFNFSEKHKQYIRKCGDCTINVAEGAVRAGKTTDNVFAFAQELKTTPDKLHLATGSTAANAMLNIGDADGHGLEHIFRGQCHWGKYKGNACLYIKGPSTENRQRIVIFAGGGLANSFKKIRGNSYGMWIGTEINLHHDKTITEAFNRQLAAKRRKIFWDLNPDHPKAVIYTKYIDDYAAKDKEGLDIGGYNYEHFTIFDNINIPEQNKVEFINQYDPKSIWYIRDIEGKRSIAEGLIYVKLATSITAEDRKYKISVEEAQRLNKEGQFIGINIGVDFGGNGSGHTFVATAPALAYEKLIALASERHTGDEIDPKKLGELFIKFVKKILDTYGFVTNIYCDSAETVLIRGLKSALIENEMGYISIKNALKRQITDRIFTLTALSASDRFYYTEDCETLSEAISMAVWNPKNIELERLDDGTSDIDSLDAFEYTFERDYKKYIKAG